MAQHAAINLRIKLKKDAPDHVRQFMDTYFFNTDIDQAIEGLESAPLTPLCALKYYPDGVGNLISMIAQCSTTHSHWCWRVKEEYDDHTLYESKASCTHGSTDEDLLVLLMSGLSPFLLINDGDILARIIHEESSQERVVVFDQAQCCCVAANGYLHKWGGDDAGDGTHPREMSRYYSTVLADKEGAVRFSRLVSESEEFYPPWNISDVYVRNTANAGKWAVERSEYRGFGY